MKDYLSEVAVLLVMLGCVAAFCSFLVFAVNIGGKGLAEKWEREAEERRRGDDR